MTWLGSPASFKNDANILIVRKDAPVKSIEEARRQDLPPLVLGGSAEGGIGNDVPIILHDTIGLHVKQVVGFPDNPAIYVAIERGEVHGRTGDLSSLKAVKPEWLDPGSNFGCWFSSREQPDIPNSRTCRRRASSPRTRLHVP